MRDTPKYSYRLHWSPEDEGYVALCSEFPTISAVGDTADEALAEIETAVAGAVEILLEGGHPLPEPRVLPCYSGQFRLRIPKYLHAELAAQAELEGVSLNTLAAACLAGALGGEQAPVRSTAAEPRVDGTTQKDRVRRSGSG